MFRLPTRIDNPQPAPDVAATFLNAVRAQGFNVLPTSITAREALSHSENRFVETTIQGVFAPKDAQCADQCADNALTFDVTLATLFLNDAAQDTALQVQRFAVRHNGVRVSTPNNDTGVSLWRIDEPEAVIARAVTSITAAAAAHAAQHA